MDTHLLFLSHAISTETMQEYVHALGTSLLIGEIRAGNIAIFIHLFQQSTFYAEVIFYHICHSQFPFFRGERVLALSPIWLLRLESEPLSEPFDRLATGHVMRKSAILVYVAHDF